MDLHTWDLPLTAIVLLLVINELIRRLMTARQRRFGTNHGQVTQADAAVLRTSVELLRAAVDVLRTSVELLRAAIEKIQLHLGVTGERCASLEARVTGLEHARHP